MVTVCGLLVLSGLFSLAAAGIVAMLLGAGLARMGWKILGIGS
jgi:hypothetical protein